MSTILVLRHEDSEPLGLVELALRAAGLDFEYVRAYAGDAVPQDAAGLRGLVVLGGPQGVYEADRIPYLADEIRLIADAVRRETPVLGICLGAQLLAAALGARVCPAAQTEVGWFPVTLGTAAKEDALFEGIEPSFVALHLHGDVLDLPEGAVWLASSALTPNQAFRFGRTAYGIQWHMEMTEEILRDTAGESATLPAWSGSEPTSVFGGLPSYHSSLSRIAGVVFGAWAKLVV